MLYRRITDANVRVADVDRGLFFRTNVTVDGFTLIQLQQSLCHMG